MAGQKRVYKAPVVRDFVWANADKPLAVEYVARELGWATGSVSTVLGGMVTDFPDQMERIRKGLYRWNSNGVAPEPEPKEDEDDEIILQVVKRNEAGRVLVMDPETRDLFTLEPYAF